jgi:hypothetical protein
MLAKNSSGKITILTMIRDFFYAPGEKATTVIQETKQLTPEDKIQLGSALARHYGVSDGDLDFTPVAY